MNEKEIWIENEGLGRAKLETRRLQSSKVKQGKSPKADSVQWKPKKGNHKVFELYLLNNSQSLFIYSNVNGHIYEKIRGVNTAD